MPTSLPAVIDTYQRAHDVRDTDASLATFTADAIVEDDGHSYQGWDAIRSWLDTAAAEFTFTRTLLGVEAVGDDAWVVTNHVAGDFPGGQVDLRYRFDLTDGLISRLVIAP